MRKIYLWKGETQNPPHAFDVEFYEDVEAGNFVAKIHMYSQMWSEYHGGPTREPAPHYEELKGTDLHQLDERTEQKIVSRGGKILTSPDHPIIDKRHEKPLFNFDDEAVKRAEQKLPRNWRED